MTYSITEIASMLGVETSFLGDPMANVAQLLIDSRSVATPATSLFFALKTKNDDGHRYIPELYNKGVRNFVVENIDELSTITMPDANFLQVLSTLDALQTLARQHRRRFSFPIIAITGSQGKTTIKEWLYTLLNEQYKIVRSPRSFNSQIGVPLSLWELDSDTSLAIIEAGISTTGEMDNLQDMIRPTIGIITNIGNEHNEGFATMREKAVEKAKILTNCEAVVFPADDPLVSATLAPLVEHQVADVVAWSMGKNLAGANLVVTHIEQSDNGSRVFYRYNDAEEASFRCPFTSERDLNLVMSCLAVMLYLGIDNAVIDKRMRQLTHIGTRINVVEGVNNTTLIVDGYTSDYNSLAPALDFALRRRAGKRHLSVLLSDLQHDAGDDAAELYIRVSELLKSKGVARIIGVGPEMCQFGKYFRGIDASFFRDTTALLDGIAPGDFEHELLLIKGAPEFDLEQVLDLLEARRHETVEEIDLNALADNFKFFRSRLKPGTRTVAMVKASGYGTGSFEIAKTLQDCGAGYLAVAVQDEGVELRRAGITTPIIVLNPSGANYKALFRNSLEPEVYSIDLARALIKEGERIGVRDYPVHIKIDSGMHRLGFTRSQLPQLLKLLAKQNVLKPMSVFSHLCVADEPNQDDYTREQFDYFTRCADALQEAFPHRILRHILNTAGTLRFADRQMDMVRLGIGLYGIKPLGDGSDDALRPVASLHSIIISIKDWDEGTTIGYGRHGRLTRPSRIATVTIGYADGFDRHFGRGRVSLWVNGKLCPTVGNVCMDACMIDVTGVDCRVGDRVEIFGPHVPIEQLSEARDTIPYEILTSVSPRVKRIYFRD